MESRHYTKWNPANRYVCQKCNEEKSFKDFHSAGVGKKNRHTRRTVCRACRNAENAEYMRLRRMPQSVCYFCDEPSVFLTYCADHWHQYREDHLRSHPDFAYYYRLAGHLADYFTIPSSVLLFGTSHRQPMVHMRTVAMLVLRHLTNMTCEKLAILFSRNISNMIRGLKKGETFYALYPEFREDVDSALKYVQEQMAH